MTATQVIKKIADMAPDEQGKAVRYAYRLDAERQLTGEELSALAGRMLESTDPVQTAMIRDRITRGFYSGKPDA